MKKIALVFPGQGSQYIGMGSSLYNNFKVAKDVFEEASDVLGFDIKKLCFEGSLVELSKIQNVLLAILTSTVATYRVYMEHVGITPQFCAGHSMGEYAALACSGAMNFSDALKICYKRSKIAEEVVKSKIGSMVIVEGIESKIVEEECNKISNDEDIVKIACYNGKEQVVIAGHKGAVTKIEDRLFELNAQITPMLASPPFHSPVMQFKCDELRSELEKYKYNKFNFPVISNVTGLPYSNENEIRDNLTMQLIKPVRWQNTIDYFVANGIEHVVEIGPQAVLSNIINEDYSNIKSIPFNYRESENLIREISNEESLENNLEKNSKSKFISKCLAMAVATKNNNLDQVDYVEGIDEPYEKLEKMQEELENNEITINEQVEEEVLELVKKIFTTKRVSLDEQEFRINIIMNEHKE